MRKCRVPPCSRKRRYFVQTQVGVKPPRTFRNIRWLSVVETEDSTVDDCRGGRVR